MTTVFTEPMQLWILLHCLVHSIRYSLAPTVIPCVAYFTRNPIVPVRHGLGTRSTSAVSPASWGDTLAVALLIHFRFVLRCLWWHIKFGFSPVIVLKGFIRFTLNFSLCTASTFEVKPILSTDRSGKMAAVGLYQKLESILI